MRWTLALLGAGVVGCAYFNGVYNARRAAARGERAAREGRLAAAESAYLASATSAESVLARHPRSRWRTDALYLAGLGAALSGECGRGVERLRDFLDAENVRAQHRNRAALALGRCLVALGAPADARAVLEPLLTNADARVADDAARWAARAAYDVGDGAAAERYLAGATPRTAQWEMLRAALAVRSHARAESLLALRAVSGDLSELGEHALRELFEADRHRAVVAIAARYAESRAGPRERARLLLHVADLFSGAHADSVARVLVDRAMRVDADTATRNEGRTRLALLDLRAATSVAELQNVARRYDGEIADSASWHRLRRIVMFVSLLAASPDPAGAGRFLAAEVARDSLGAKLIAHALMREVAADAPSAPLAAKALLAAAELQPDSSAAHRVQVITKYPHSPYAYVARGLPLPDSATFAGEISLLSAAWSRALASLSDSLRAANGRAAVSAAATAGSSPSPL